VSIYLSIVVPFFNEEESIVELISRIVDTGDKFDFAFEIILIDDGSTDKTWQKIQQQKKRIPNLVGIKFRRNYGQTNAMVAGFDHASGEIIVTMDGDLQNDPRDIPRLLEKIEEGYDVVCGWRQDRKDKTLTRIIPSKVANWLIGKLTGVPIHDNGCSLKAYRSSVIKSTKLYSDMHRFIPAMTTIIGARITEIVVNHMSRKFGKTKYGLSRVWKVLFDMITVKMLIHFFMFPLLLFTVIGLFFCFLGISFWVGSFFFLTSGEPVIILGTAGALFFALFAVLLFWGLLAEFFIKVEIGSAKKVPNHGKNISVI
jgi:glycosyltransferase involved in cell wall biosynthesis